MHKANDLSYEIYWEKQGVDSLCGVHCINSLLQGPFFDEIKLSEIALELDRQEHELMKEQGMTDDYIKYLKQESGNVAMDGNYSIQVLQEALKKLNLAMISIDTIDNKSDLNSKKGFICNSQAHWIAIRRINDTWYNLNSLGMRLPQIISDFYLSAFLMAVKQCGYQIFSVEGDYPNSNADSFDHYNEHQEWYPAKRVKKYHQKKSKRKGYKPNISSGNDGEMEKAIAMSLGKKYDKYVSSGEDSDWENDDKKKQVKPFSGAGVSMGGGGANVPFDKFELHPDDVEMITIMRMNLEEEFKNQPKEGIQVTFRYPSGKKERRRFQSGQLIQSLYDYVWMKKPPHEQFYLVDFLSKQKLMELETGIIVMADPEDNTVMVSVIQL